MPKADMYSQGWADLSDKQKSNFESKADFKASKQAFRAKQAKKEVRNSTADASVAEMQNLKNSGDVQNKEAQALLQKKINKAKAANAQAKTDRQQYQKDDKDYLDVDQLNQNPNPDNYGAKATKVVGKLERVNQKLQKEGLSDERRAELEAKQESLKTKRDKNYAKQEAYDSFDKNDISTYDPAAVGKGKFDAKDVAYLKNQGFSQEEITNYANSLDRSKISGSAQVLDGYDIHRDNLMREDGTFDASAIGSGGNNQFTQKDLRAMRAQGMTKKEMARQMYDQMDSSTRGKKAQKLLDRYINEFTSDDTAPPPGETEPDPVEPTPTPEPNPVEPTPTPTNPTPTPTNPTPTPTNPTPTPTNPAPGQPITTGPIEQENEQEIINEDVNNTTIDDSFNGGTIGDIDQGGTINGNNNTINNTVDNSNNSRYYGGNNTVWNINNSNQSANTGFALGGGNYTGGVTSPLSNLTMMGYGKPSDSPSANAQFVDMYQTMNADAQKKYANVGTDTANKYIQMARANNPVNYEGIQKTLSGYYNEAGELVPGTAQDFYNKAVKRQTQFMGDYANFRPQTYNFPDPPEAIDDNLDEVADDYNN